jgi:hypothetical protein
MPNGYYFSPSSFPIDAYDKTLKDLEAAGVGSPAGRQYHFALEIENNIHVFDIWESQEAFEAFGATLLPILAAEGVDPGAPMVSPIHNVIVGG